MKTSMVGDIRRLIDGAHVMGPDGLRDYHAAAAAVNACRKHDFSARLAGVRKALKNYNVQVFARDNGIAMRIEVQRTVEPRGVWTHE